MNSEEKQRLREYCIKEGLDFLTVYAERVGKVTKVPITRPIVATIAQERPIQIIKERTLQQTIEVETPLSIEEQTGKKPVLRTVITNVLKQIRKDRKEEQIGLDYIVGEVSQRLQSEGIDPKETINSPLKGIVSFVIYDNAQRAKNKAQRLDKKTPSPLEDKDLKKFSRLNLDSYDIAHVLGDIKTPYVLANYPLSNGVFVDSQGQSLSIEGADVWNGENKKTTRYAMNNFVYTHFMGDIIDQEKNRRTLDSRLQEVDRLIPKTQFQLEQIGKADLKLAQLPFSKTFRIHGRQRGQILAFRKRFFGGDMNQHVTIESINDTTIEVTAKSKESLGHFGQAMLNAERASRGSEGKRFKGISIKYQEIANNVSSEYIKTNGQLTSLQEERARLVTQRQTMSAMGIKSSMHYLGLEGPGFGSYLSLFTFLRSKGIKLEAYLPESSARDTRLMQSLANAHENPETGLFRDTSIRQADLDELVRLDFPNSPDFRIKKKMDIEATKREKKATFVNLVEYRGQTIPLNAYEEMISSLDNNPQADKSKIASQFGVSEEFVAAASDRYRGKFDILFLDYFGGHSKKRTATIKRLMESRISDKGVLAVTTNLEAIPNMNLKHEYGRPLNPDEIENIAFDDIFRIQDSIPGLKFTNVDHQMYKDSRHQMSFMLFGFEKYRASSK